MGSESNRELEIFSSALERATPAERAAYLDGVCGEDFELRTRIETLLHAHVGAGGFLPPDNAKSPVAAPPKTIVITPGIFPVTEKPGDRIGRYKLREKVGEGGCGVVYVAEQEQPVRRRVALKVIKLGMDTKSVIARFEAERQALAMMDHPNIAKVLDAGATEAGRPYFVMELVRGIKITDYCDQNKLPTSERLDLFTKVCQAIQHAHQKGIIHRDIKPSNILVTLHDGVPVPKIIDFGISKATEGRLTELTVYTELHQFIGTPAYMSPEQAEMSGLDIDTRSDIYSLGVLLYELLTGRTPFDGKELIESGLDAMRKTIRETEPLRPSTRLSTMLNAELTAVAHRQGAEPPRLLTLIRGDLDWVVMKALEKDRTRRYDTANGLAMDVNRYLADEPIIARPPSSIYRFQKLVRRNKLVFTAAAVVVMALLVGICLAGWSLVRERAARARAEAAQQVAGTEAAKQEAINNFLNEMFAAADPDALSAQDQTKGRAVTVAQVLDAAARQLDGGNLNDRPEIEAAVRQTLGNTYESLGQFADAYTQLRRALDLNKQVYGPESLNTAHSLNALSHLRMAQDNLPEAEQLQREELAIQQKLHGGREHPDVARALYGLAMIRMEEYLGTISPNEEKKAESEAAFREALAMQRRLLPSKDRDLAKTLTGLARLLTYRQKTDEAETLFREALAMQKELLGPEHPDVAVTMQQFSEDLRIEKKFAEAEDMCNQAIAIQRKMLGNDHPALGTSLLGRGEVLADEGKNADAEVDIREALSIRQKALGEDNIHVAWCLKMLAEGLVAQQKLPEAEQVYREALPVWVKCRGLDADGYQDAVKGLIETLKSEGKVSEIEPILRQTLAQERASLGEQSPFVAATLSQQADFLESQNRSDEAAQKSREAIDIVFKSITEDPDKFPSLIDQRAQELVARGEPRDAEMLYDEAIKVAHEKLGESNPAVATLHHNYGEMLMNEELMNEDEGKCEASEQQFSQALAIRRATSDDKLGETLHNLADVQMDAGKFKDAEQYSREALALNRKLHPKGDYWGTTFPATILANVLYAQQKLPEAERAYRDALTTLTKSDDYYWLFYARLAFPLSHILETENRLPEAQALRNDPVFNHRRINVAALLLNDSEYIMKATLTNEAVLWSRDAANIMQKLSPDDFNGVPADMVSPLLKAGYRQEATNICWRYLESSTTNAVLLNDASWPFSTTENPTNRDPVLAVELAKRAVKFTSERWVWNTLGIADYRIGDFKQAIANLEKSVQVNYGGQSPDFFFLAMAHWQLGDAETARQFYAQGVQWMTDHDPQNRALIRFRTEAEHLLNPSIRDQIENQFPSWPNVK